MSLESRNYKAAIYRGPGEIEIVEKTLAECGDNDVIVKNLYATICGADYNAYRANGDAQQVWRDHEFGHEMVSEVVEVGKNVTDVKVGDWVFPNLGYAHHDRGRMATVGGFSEYLYLPDFRLDGDFAINTVEAQPSAILLDKSLGIKNLCLLEPFAVGTKAAFDDICDMIRGGVDLSPLVTQEFQLDQICDAMEAHGDVEKAQKVAISYL